MVIEAGAGSEDFMLSEMPAPFFCTDDFYLRTRKTWDMI